VSRFGSSIRLLACTGGKPIDAKGTQLGDVERNDGPPVDGLVAASEMSDLVVVGSRGLHGLASLGSVSKRVAHHAHSSVLVVRGRVEHG
jgi:nucleotide-binding universal stress UspA family protein